MNLTLAIFALALIAAFIAGAHVTQRVQTGQPIIPPLPVRDDPDDEPHQEPEPQKGRPIV